MKLRLKLTAQQAEAAILQGINLWREDSHVEVRTLGVAREFWRQIVDQDSFSPGDRVLINSGNNVVGVRKTPTGGELLLDSRRHGMASPSISSVLVAAGLIRWDGSPTFAGRKAAVLQYDSLRTDCPWWAVGLDHPEVVKIKKTAEELSLTLTPPEDGMELTFDGSPVWAFPGDWENAQKFKWSTIAYRRAGASGIKL